MSKRHNQIVLTLTILLDLGIVLGAWNLAYWLRFDAVNLPPAQFLNLDARSLATLEPRGLSPEAIKAVLDANNPPATSELDLRNAVNRALAPLHLQSLTPQIVRLAQRERSVPPFSVYARVNTFLLIVSIVLFYALGIYRSRRFRSWRTELDAVIKAAAAVVSVTVGASFFYRTYSYSRVHMAYFAVCLLAGLICNRLAIRWVVRLLRRHGRLVRRCVLAGDSALAVAFYERWKSGDHLGLQLLGLVTPGPTVQTEALRGLPHLGTLQQLPQIVQAHHVQEVISAFTLEQYRDVQQLNRLLEDHYVDHRIVPDLGTTQTLSAEVETFDGLPMIAIMQGPLEGWNKVFKRMLDVAGSIAALIVFSPFLLVIPILIKLTSPGPVFYVQERMGWNGKTFGILKFRSMPINAEQHTGPVWASEHDARPTALGAVLRKTNLDELPQLFNVLRGDMSLVGPRPERPVFIHEFRKRIPHYMQRHKIKSGMTGWAQINGWRGNTSLEKRIECDLFYISNWSIGFDFRILFLTLFKGFFHHNAY